MAILFAGDDVCETEHDIDYQYKADFIEEFQFLDERIFKWFDLGEINKDDDRHDELYH